MWICRRRWPLSLVVVVAALLTTSCFSGGSWRAKVVSVDGSTVCTVPDAGQRDPGWRQPFCLGEPGYEFATRDGTPVPVVVGDCVVIVNYHPTWYVRDKVPCGD